MAKNEPLEKLLWSIALPGFGQLLNGMYLKGVVLVALEFFINVFGNINEVIISSFQGNIETAIGQADFLYIMFYPCMYFFAMWDAYKDAGGGIKPFSFLPFVFGAYFMTVGVIYSSVFTFFGIMPGPIWLPLLSIIPGVFTGLLLQKILRKKQLNA
ncbi:hypothetical protein ACUL41_02990 [Virgibacillus natechei]|uniref:hypothetical protein n=1 Tax=Virgibacillus sp. CBA3643 TaxID=2942278 RepID=UPI0035A317B1